MNPLRRHDDYAAPRGFGVDEARGEVDPLLLPLQVARSADGKVRSGGIAPVRVNLIAAGSAGLAAIPALAMHLMTNSAITGATVGIDGGQQLVEPEA